MPSVTDTLTSTRITGTSVVPTKWGVEVTSVGGHAVTLFYTTRAEARVAKNFFSNMTSNVEGVKLV